MGIAPQANERIHTSVAVSLYLRLSVHRNVSTVLSEHLGAFLPGNIPI